MSKAHRSRILRLRDVLVPTTNDTISLWHFDKHLQSTNGIKPSWNLGRIAEGKFGNGVLVQENTVNHIPDGSFEQGVLQGPYAGVSRGTLEIVEGGLFGKHCLKHTANDSNSYTVSYSGSSNAVLATTVEGETWTASVWCRAESGTCSVQFHVFGLDSSYSYVTLKSVVSTVGTEWTKIEATYTATTGILYVSSRLDNDGGNGAIVYWDGWQLEQKAYVTPFIESSILNEKLSYLMPPPVAVSCYFKLASTETRSTVGDDRVLLWYAKVDDQGNYYDNVSSWKVYIPGGSNTLRLQCVNAQQALTPKNIDITNAELNIYDGGWHFMCIRHNGTNMQFQVDGITKDISSSLWTTAPVFEAQKFGIGCDPEGFSRSANVYVDELRCDSIYISDDEIEAWRASDRPFYDPYDYSVVEIGPVPRKYIKNFGTYRAWNDGSLAKSAYDYRYPDPNVGEYAGDIGSGIYKIRTSTGEVLNVYCDMENDGGGWTLLVCSDDDIGWDTTNVLERNISSPAISGNYSCLRIADSIKHDFSGELQYRIDAQNFRRWGGIWEAPYTYSFVKTDNTQTNVTLLTKYDIWEYHDNSVEQRMPWLGATYGYLTTSTSSSGSWWGTLVSYNGSYHPAPWISPEMEQPGVIWYWVR